MEGQTSPAHPSIEDTCGGIRQHLNSCAAFKGRRLLLVLCWFSTVQVKKGEDLKPWACSSSKTINHFFFNPQQHLLQRSSPGRNWSEWLLGCDCGDINKSGVKVLLFLFYPQSHRTREYTNTEQCLGRAMDSGSCHTSRPALACSKLAWGPWALLHYTVCEQWIELTKIPRFKVCANEASSHIVRQWTWASWHKLLEKNQVSQDLCSVVGQPQLVSQGG